MSDFQGESTGQEAWAIGGPFVGAGLVVIIALLIGFFKDRDSSKVAYLSTTTIGLLPWLITAAGPLMSVITTDGSYSIATTVGVIGTLFTSFIGSQKFTDFSKSVFFAFGEGKSWISWLIIPIMYLVIGLPLYFLVSSKSAITAVIESSMLILPLVAGAYNLLRNPDLAAIPITSFPGKIAAYITGTPIVAAAATGGGIIEITGETCVLPGYDGLEVQLAPSNVVLPMTILLCHLVEYLDTQNYGGATAVGGLAATIFFLQYASFLSNSCSKYYRWGIVAPLIGLVLAGIYAGSAYGVIKYWTGGTENFGTDGIFHPSTAAAPPPTKTAGKSDIKIKTSGAAVTASADLFDQAENEDYEEVVGVLFKDGEPISDVSILKS